MGRTVRGPTKRSAEAGADGVTVAEGSAGAVALGWTAFAGITDSVSVGKAPELGDGGNP